MIFQCCCVEHWEGWGHLWKPSLSSQCGSLLGCPVFQSERQCVRLRWKVCHHFTQHTVFCNVMVATCFLCKQGIHGTVLNEQNLIFIPCSWQWHHSCLGAWPLQQKDPPHWMPDSSTEAGCQMHWGELLTQLLSWWKKNIHDVFYYFLSTNFSLLVCLLLSKMCMDFVPLLLVRSLRMIASSTAEQQVETFSKSTWTHGCWMAAGLSSTNSVRWAQQTSLVIRLVIEFLRPLSPAHTNYTSHISGWDAYSEL